MSEQNSAIIITDSEKFRNHFSSVLKQHSFSPATMVRADYQQHYSLLTNVDCFVLDNEDGKFPSDVFLNNIPRRIPLPLIIVAGEPLPNAGKKKGMIFTVDGRQDRLSLPELLNNAARLFSYARSQMELSAMLLHDIRSPLNSLIGYLELLLNETFGELNEGQKNIIGKSMEMGDSMLDMLEDLSEVFIGEQNILQIQKGSFQFCKVLEQALVNVWIKADHKSIQIKKEVPREFPELFIDDYQILRLLTNLLSNAIKYSPAHSQIIIRARLESESVAHIVISDNGGGVPEEEVQNLFNKFYRVKKKNITRNGHGLGLYISKLIVNAHNGRIWAENNHHGGLSVHFTLPVTETLHEEARAS